MKRFSEAAGAAYERGLEIVFVDVILIVGGGENFGLVDVIDADGLEDLCFDEVTDSRG